MPKKPINTFVGIVSTIEQNDRVSFSILNIKKKVFVFREFQRHNLFDPEQGFLSFLKESISDKEKVQVIACFPTLFEEESIYAKVLTSLPQTVLCSFIHGVYPTDEKDMLFGIGAGFPIEKQPIFALFEKTILRTFF
ncbi:MAG: hypothetical protein LH702_19755 [Phormidesmis sp. CAN_BIN44]|nr:hypothetical protein [Phormidesmis sp. CAN_BIN44]